MKTEKILALVLALVLILASALPARAAEGGEPVLPGQEETIPPDVLPLPDEEVTGGEIPDDGVPSDEVPSDEVPSDAVPGDEVPGDEVPGGEVPGDEVPGDEVPGDEVPDDEMPDEETPDGETPDGEETPDEPEPAVINVQVPASGRVVINPYYMEVAVSYGETTEQIVHEPQVLTSGSDFPVLVSARAVGTLPYGSEARFTAAPPAPDAQDKQIFMYVEFQPADFLWSYAFSDAPNQLLVTDWGMEKENVLTLEPFGAGYFRLFGSMTDYPDTMWGEIDAPNVTLAFTFAPLADVMDTEEMLPPEGPVEEPVEGPIEEPVEEPAEGPVEEPVEDPAEAPAEGPVEEPAEAPAEGPVEEPRETPAEGPVEEPAEASAEGPEEEPAEVPVQDPMEENNGW